MEGIITTFTNKRVEFFKVMPNLRWVERTEYLTRSDGYGETEVYGERNIKVLQQLHLGDMGTERWEDVPIATED